MRVDVDTRKAPVVPCRMVLDAKVWKVHTGHRVHFAPGRISLFIPSAHFCSGPGSTGSQEQMPEDGDFGESEL